MKIFKDCFVSTDEIQVGLSGNIIGVEVQDYSVDSTSTVELDKETARAMGEYLIKLSEEMT